MLLKSVPHVQHDYFSDDKGLKCYQLQGIEMLSIKGLKCYQLPQEEVDRIERMLKGGNDSDNESDDESVEKDAASEDEIDDHPRRVLQ